LLPAAVVVLLLLLLLVLLLLSADVQWSLGQAGVGAAGGCMCVVWLFTALALGRKHKQLASSALKT
jgi:Ca2+/Na+ antiporter